MHEWALAEAVIATVERLRAEQGGRAVLAVRLRIGELQSVDREAFRTGLEVSLEGRPYGPEVFQLLTEPASFRCRACARQWSLGERSDLGPEEREAIHFLPESAHAYMRCPGCGSPDFELTAGRGVAIESVDFERGDD
jgi:hydrogenase nickel incorporation protein HypA/HybF